MGIDAWVARSLPVSFPERELLARLVGETRLSPESLALLRAGHGLVRDRQRAAVTLDFDLRRLGRVDGILGGHEAIAVAQAGLRRRALRIDAADLLVGVETRGRQIEADVEDVVRRVARLEAAAERFVRERRTLARRDDVVEV